MKPKDVTDQRDRQTYAVIGAAMEVHRVLGGGFLEPVYQMALRLELEHREIPFVAEVALPVQYKGTTLQARYRADFICFGDVLVETKSMERLSAREEGQVINYLAATGLGRGLLLNFGSTHLQFKRFAGPARLLPVSSVPSVGPKA